MKWVGSSGRFRSGGACSPRPVPPACYYPQISTLEFRRRSVGLKAPEVPSGPKARGERRKITAFSHRSRNRLREVYLDGPWQSMLTLTYHERRPDGAQSKRELDRWLQMLRRRKICYLWVLEWQTRGYPHYHVWIDRTLPEIEWTTLMAAWASIASPGDQKAMNVALHPDSYLLWTVTVKSNYATKYAIKNEQKVLPEDIESYGRWWGSSRGVDGICHNEKLETYPDEDGEVDQGAVVAYRQIRRYLASRQPRPYRRNFVGEIGCQTIRRIVDFYLRRTGSPPPNTTDPPNSEQGLQK